MPKRADIEPAGFVAFAPQVFIAEREPAGDVIFRLAGEVIVELHGKPLRGESLLRLWRPDCRARLSMLLAAGLSHAAPMVLLAEARADDRVSTEIEILFAPLTASNGAADRFLGLYQPIRSGWIGRVGEFSILAVNGLTGPAERGRLRLAALDGRRIA